MSNTHASSLNARRQSMAMPLWTIGQLLWPFNDSNDLTLLCPIVLYHPISMCLI
jgi:hypothetical protein